MMNSTFLLPRSKSRQGFEPLLDEEDVQKINQRRFWASTCLIFLICICFLSHSFDMHIWTFPTRNLPSTFHNDNIPPSSKEEGRSHDEHTLPTILSIIDPSTDKYINAIENTLYQELKALTITERRNLERMDRNFPLFLDKYIMYPLRQPLTIFWEPSLFVNDPTNFNKDNLIALYCPVDSPHANFLDAATIDQILATSRRHGGKNENEWYIPSFPITKHETCEFRLFSRHVTKDVENSNNVLEWMGSSPTLHLPAASRTPNNIHLALSHDPEEIVVQFQTGERGTPIAMFGIESDTSFQKVEGTTHTYRAEDLCAEPANVTEVGKFQDPGMIHVVRLTNLQPNTQYVYKVGLASGQGVVWSDYFNFQSPPSVGLLDSFSFLVYGDQGCPEVGWGLGGAWTAAMAAREKGIRMVHHFGDLSYAMGAAHIWDEWMHMIQSFAASVPLMVGIGNHEYDHTHGGSGGKDPSGITEDHGFMPEWGNFGDDSGGECGVPTSQRFTMPSKNNSNGVFWYSYDFANVHTIMISSEHNLTVGSMQYNWLLDDLQSVNRSVTPWLILELHRPLYQSEFFFSQNAVGVAMRYEIEDLLKEYHVDLVLSGHYHSYLRTCDGLYRSKCQNGGPMHVCIGSAGARLDIALLYPQEWTDVFIQQEWGYGRVTVANASSLLFEFVKAGAENDTDAGRVRDHVWINRHR